jgi:hypothetical protein
MKLSIILIDWNVRESYHSVEYLNRQTIERKNYEIIWVEYYNKQSSILKQYEKEGKLDKYIVLGHSQASHYHKHIAWNEGVLSSVGDILVFPDSDAMFKDSFVETILNFFEKQKNAFLLIDEVRNKNKKYYPFNFPSFEEVLNDEKSENYNKVSKTTNGLTAKNKKIQLPESFFIRNYGACLCVLKTHFVKCGGLDEFEGYRSYICGVYELVFRLKNKGLKECWSEKEFLIHTYHPWMNPGKDKMGPHFRHLSALGLFQYYLKNTLPLKENKQILKLRTQGKGNLTKDKYSIVFVISDKNKNKFLQIYYNLQKATTRDFCILLPYKVKENFNNVFYIKNLDNIEDKFDLLKKYGEVVVIQSDSYFFSENELDKFFNLNNDFIKFDIYKCFQKGFLWTKSNTKTMDCIFKANKIKNYNDFKIKSANTKVGDLKLFDFNCNGLKTNIDYNNLINDILNLEFLINGLGKYELLNKAKLVFEKAIARNDFLTYFFLNRCSLMEFYRFIGVFKQKERGFSLKGYMFLAENIDFVLKHTIKKIPEKFNFIAIEIKRDLTYFKGVSYFHIGDIYMKSKEYKNAKLYFEQCLTYIPDHRKAKEFLRIL